MCFTRPNGFLPTDLSSGFFNNLKGKTEMKKKILYVMIVIQLIVWGWFSIRGGRLGDTEFFIFTIGMLIGQIGAGVETFISKSWGTFTVQVYFFCFTLYGGIVRFLTV